MFKVKKKNLAEFVTLVSSLTPEEFIGITRILKVRCFEQERDAQNRLVPRESLQIVEDCIAAFDKLNRTERRQLLKILRATKG